MTDLCREVGELRIVKIADIKVGKRIRKDPGDIDALAASIRHVGLLQPIVAAHSLKRQAVGIEINPGVAAEAAERVVSEGAA